MTFDIEDRKRAEKYAILQLQPSTIQNRIKERIRYLNDKDKDLLIIADLTHDLRLFGTREFRYLIKNIRAEMKKYRNKSF